MSLTALGLGALAVAASIVLFVVIGLAHDTVHDRRARRLAELQAEIASVLMADAATSEASMGRLLDLPSRLLLDAAQRLAVDLDGNAVVQLRRVAEAAGLDRRIRRLSRARRWRIRVQAAQLQNLLPDGDPVRSRLLRDRRSTVRARTAESMSPDNALVSARALLGQLDDSSQDVRLAAQQALLRCDGRLAPKLMDYLTSDDKPGTTLALEVAANLTDPTLLPALARHARSDDPERRRMVAYAAGSGTQGERASLLEPLLGDGDADVRSTAADSVGRLGAPTLAPLAGALLSDSSWEVRRAAGIALSRLGPVGLLVLRTHLSDPDPFAADMARQTLEAAAIRQLAALPLIPDVLVSAVDDWEPRDLEPVAAR